MIFYVLISFEVLINKFQQNKTKIKSNKCFILCYINEKNNKINYYYNYYYNFHFIFSKVCLL